MVRNAIALCWIQFLCKGLNVYNGSSFIFHPKLAAEIKEGKKKKFHRQSHEASSLFTFAH